MITDHVPAVRVPRDYAGRRGVAAVAARGDVEDRRDLDPAPPARRAAAPADAKAEAELGGQGPARYPARRNTESAAPRTAAAGHPGHDPGLAPRHRPPPLGRPVRARQDRPAGNPRGTSRSWSAGWPARTPTGDTAGSTASSPVWGLRSQRPPSGRSSRPAASTPRRRQTGPDLVTIPALPGRGDPGLRLLHRRPARRHPGLRPGRDRARDPAHPHPRQSPCIPPGSGPPSRPATCSWTSASKRTGSGS